MSESKDLLGLIFVFFLAVYEKERKNIQIIVILQNLLKDLSEVIAIIVHSSRRNLPVAIELHQIGRDLSQRQTKERIQSHELRLY